MSLPVRQQWSLWRIEHALRQSDPRLVTLIANFTRFALDGRVPDHERLRPRTARGFQVLGNAFWHPALLASRVVHRSRGAFAWLGARLRRVLAGSPSFDVAATAQPAARPGSGTLP